MASCLRTHSCASRPARSSRWRLVALLLSGLTGVLGSQAHAVGLGEIRVDSALNQRLEAEIPLIDIGDLQADELRISLASAADFERVGVERFFFLSDLRFRVEVGRSGGLVVVYSEGPVTEPYLNFLVQLQWPQGRILKEYTVLLDPPAFSQAAAPAIQGAVQAPSDVGSAGSIERPPAVFEPAPVAAPARPMPARVDGERVGNEYRMGDGPETLWSIASRHRPSRAVSVQQTMLAIQRLNPEAFIGGNINRLKWGQTLRLPDEAEVNALTPAEAVEQVALQDSQWRSGVAAAPAAPQPAATEPAAIDAAPERAGTPAATDGEGRLRIVAGSGESVTGSAAEPAAAGEGQQSLSAALEERDRLTLEVTDLTSALDREKELAASQLAVKDRQIEVKDQQIAELQAELARLRAGEAVAAENQDQSASAPAVPWWQSPTVLAAGAGALVLLLVLGLVAARRRRAASEAPFVPARGRDEAPRDNAARSRAPAVSPRPGLPEVTSVTPQASPAATVATGAAALGGAALAGAALAGASETAAAPAASAGASTTGGELVDVVGEADIYIAYGRFGQATSLLQNALAEDPDRHEVRLKLLEVYTNTGDRAAFDREWAELADRCTEDDVLSAAAALAAQMHPEGADGAAGLLEDADLGGPGFQAAAGAAATLQSREGSGAAPALDLGELEFEFPDEPVPDAFGNVPAAPEGSGERGAAETGELDLQTGQVEAIPEEARPASEGSRADLLGGDLGLEFRLEEDDLDNLDEHELALEMDGQPALQDAAPEEDFEFADEADSASTKLDLARAYNEMGDPEGAREILLEVLKEGSEAQQQAARELLDRL